MGKAFRVLMLERLGPREDLGIEVALERYWKDWPVADIHELFELWEFELKISAGYMRPDDDLTALLAPVKLRNPFTWFATEPKLEDATSEINYRLASRRRERGWPELDRSPLTMADLVGVWCCAEPTLGEKAST